MDDSLSIDCFEVNVGLASAHENNGLSSNVRHWNGSSNLRDRERETESATINTTKNEMP